MRQYRVIYDSPTNGNRNMAIDEAIMTAVAQGESLPTLRLYAWNPPCNLYNGARLPATPFRTDDWQPSERDD